MRSPGRPAAPSRPTSLAWGALAALLAACGGTTEPPPPPPTCDVPATVTADQAWQLYGPSDWNPACATLTVRAPALATDERLALVLVNAGGPDNTTATVGLTGTLAFAAADATPVAREAPGPLAVSVPLADPAPYDRAPLEAGHALVVERRRAATAAWLADGAPRPAAPATRRQAATAAAEPAIGEPRANGGFCVYSFTTNATTRRAATLRWITPHALFYVADDVWTGFQRVLAARPDLWTTLESYLEGTVDATRNPTGEKRIVPALHEAFGPETDVDQNGRLIFLFADLGRDPASGGFTVGYFDGTDVVRPLDTTAGCTNGASNGADMLYLLDPCTFNKNGITPTPATCTGAGGFPYATVLDQEVPGTMAHELQHDVMFNARCVAGSLASCPLIDDFDGDLWLNEGLSMVSEDFSGFGLHGSSERSRVGVYLSCKKPSSTALCHRDVSLTTWPAGGAGDPFGHYGGSHAFLRWHLDQAADPAAVSRALVGSAQPSRAAFAAASGVPFEEGFARFATAALFSGEDALFASYPQKPSPDWSFAPLPAPWAPLHVAVGKVGYTTLPRPGGAAFAASLRADGWGSLVTGRGTGTDATLTITSSAAVKPRAAVVRFKGSLLQP